jgi:hypothetical protein
MNEIVIYIIVFIVIGGFCCSTCIHDLFYCCNKKQKKPELNPLLEITTISV